MDNTLKHFIIWAKKGYDEHTLDEVVCRITASPPGEVRMRDKLYWLKKTCRAAGIDGYRIIDLLEEKSGAPYIEYDNELELLIYVMKVKLMCLKTRKENGDLIFNLDIPPLFKEGK